MMKPTQIHTEKRYQFQVGPWRLIQSRAQHICDLCGNPVKLGRCYTRRTGRGSERLTRLWCHLSCVKPQDAPPVDQDPAAIERLRRALLSGKGGRPSGSRLPNSARYVLGRFCGVWWPSDGEPLDIPTGRGCRLTTTCTLPAETPLRERRKIGRIFSTIASTPALTNPHHFEHGDEHGGSITMDTQW